jgi:uncharacterized protein (TIGR00299 family) protein
MRICWLDPFSGISGDMFLGALIDAGLALTDLQGALDTLGVEGLKVSADSERRNGIGATSVKVTFPEQREHRNLADIVGRLEASALPDEVKSRAIAVFLRLAEAEAVVHRVDPHQVHFHEVGAADALADITGTCFGLHRLEVRELLVGSVNVGSGTVNCAHGLLPVPAPATLRLLTGWTLHARGPQRELTTPTGAALVTSLGRQVAILPALRSEAVGYGAGAADLEGWPNVARLVIGEAEVMGSDYDGVLAEELAAHEIAGAEGHSEAHHHRHPGPASEHHHAGHPGEHHH